MTTEQALTIIKQCVTTVQLDWPNRLASIEAVQTIENALSQNPVVKPEPIKLPKP